MNEIIPPPPALDCARVIEFAVIDKTVHFEQQGCLIVDGKIVGRVPNIAICQNLDESTLMIFHCDADWNVLGIQADYRSLQEAKSKLEKSYVGLAPTAWICTAFSIEDAVEYIRNIFSGEECSFCGRVPPQINRIISKNKVRICNLCIVEFWSQLQ
jgi:hypothetical protein